MQRGIQNWLILLEMRGDGPKRASHRQTVRHSVSRQQKFSSAGLAASAGLAQMPAGPRGPSARPETESFREGMSSAWADPSDDHYHADGAAKAQARSVHAATPAISLCRPFSVILMETVPIKAIAF